MQINITPELENWLNEKFNDGTSIRDVRRDFENKLNEDDGPKVNLSMDHIKQIWTQMGLDVENRPKVKKQIEFVIVSKKLTFEALTPQTAFSSAPVGMDEDLPDWNN